MRIVSAGDTHIGQVRASNEDAVFVGETIWVVADGMGGAAGGHIASATAVETLSELDGSRFDDAEAAAAAMTRAVQEANRAVRETASEEPRLEGMGTTVTAAMLDGSELYIGHVGDSRAYLLRDGELRQITRDHSLVQELVDLGRLTEEEAQDHPQAAIITRAVGLAVELSVDVETLTPQLDDRLLLCSDGLTGVVGEHRIAESLRSAAGPAAAVERLIDLANEAGGRDNITVVVMAFHAS